MSNVLIFIGTLFLFFTSCEGCINNIRADIVFALDEAQSVGASPYGDFSDTLTAVSDTVGRLNIDPTNGVRVGVMALHNVTYARRVFGLADYTSVSTIQSAVISTAYGGLSGTDMTEGLNFGCFEMFGGPDDRWDAPNYLVYLVHGYTNTSLALEAADSCKAIGITIAVVAIETSSDTGTLQLVSSSSSYFLNTDFFCLAGNLARHTYTLTNCQWYCDAGGMLVKGGDTSSTSSNPIFSGHTFLYTSTYAQFKCCGRIYSWEFYARESGTLSLQVWKPVGGTTYRLVGVNTLYIPSNAVNTEHRYIVPHNERITVNTGDYFGWHSSGVNIIPYQITGDSSDVIMYANIGDVSRGTEVNFGSAATESGNKFAIKVTIENDDGSFWFPDSGYTLTLFDHTEIGSTVFNWSVGQKDQELLSYGLWTEPLSANGKFGYSHSSSDVTGYVTLESSLNLGSTYELTLSAADTCTHCGSGILNVNVDNLPPRIISLPSYYELHEDTDLSSNIVLHYLETEDGSGDTVTCSKRSTVPSTTIFGVWNGGNPRIVLKAGSTLDFDSASEYRIKVRCTDGKEYDDEFFKVFIRRNVPPTITNMFTHLDWVAADYPASSALTIPTTDDPDSTSFTYSIDYCGSPPESTVCPATLSTSSGSLQTSMAMSSFTGGGFNVRLKVSDGQTESGPYPISVRVYDLNDSPVIFNLPLADRITITEGIPPFTWLYTAQFYDINNWNSMTMTASISPTEGQTYFQITKTINDQDTVQTSSQQINYETLTNKDFTVSFSLTDGIVSISKLLIITVKNENEGLFFALAAYTLAADEGEVDTVVGDPSFVVVDIDGGDSVQFSFDCGTATRYYKMDKTTGIVSYAWNMDVDKGYTRQAVCTVTAWDSGYLTATTKLTITVYDINDNWPRFDKKYYTYWTTSSTAVGTVLGTIAITDADITHPHNYVERVWITNQPNDIKYFDRNETTGEFFINRNLSDIGDGNVLELTIYAEDYGHLRSSATITIILPSETTTTTTTTTDTPMNAMDDAATTVWISCAVIAGAGACGLALYMACNYKCDLGSSQSKPKDKLPKKKNPGRGRDIVFRDSGIC